MWISFTSKATGKLEFAQWLDLGSYAKYLASLATPGKVCSLVFPVLSFIPQFIFATRFVKIRHSVDWGVFDAIFPRLAWKDRGRGQQKLCSFCIDHILTWNLTSNSIKILWLAEDSLCLCIVDT